MSRPSRRHAIVSLLVLGLCMALVGQPAAQSAPGSLENAIKATYLLKLPPFVSWRAPVPTDAFTVCVLGQSPITPLIRQAAIAQSIDQRPVAVRILSSATAAQGCQEVLVAEADSQSNAAALATLRGMPVLTVTSGQTDPAARGIINFVLANGRVRFEVDLRAAAADGITISSKLLSIAVDVHGSAH